MLPFAIVGSEEEIEIDGEAVRARIYPWGIVEVDNPKHSDFSRLRGALLRSNTLRHQCVEQILTLPQYTSGGSQVPHP